VGKTIHKRVERSEFIVWLGENQVEVEFIFHIGARTDTTEFDVAIFDELNLHYSQSIWKACVAFQIPLVYASSAATYGLGELGYSDDHALIHSLKPLNPYGESKNDFDKWVLTQAEQPPFWAGLKFFNVYGPNEYHKGRMASVVLHAFRQIRDSGSMKLFRSHREGIADGYQSRDFIYVKDVVKVCYFLMEHRPQSGIYNLGTGIAQPFITLATETFRAMNREPQITWEDTPLDIRDTYQYFTQADMSKLRAAGYTAPFQSLASGVEEYVQQYLLSDSIF
jgi:ADP-L-glycero-D-manno-heptose 6-epimerase